MLECHLHRFRDVGFTDEYHIYGIGDVHAGNKNILESSLDRTIARVQEDPLAYWFGMGDMGDWIAFSDRRFEEYEMADWIDISDPWMSTLDWLEDKFKPIAEKCLGMISGNHEVTVAKRYHMHVHKHLCARLRTINLGEMAFYRLIFHRINSKTTAAFDNLLIHGWGGGRTSGARTNKMEQLMRDNLARVYWMGHVHGQLPVLHSALRRMSSRNRMIYENRVGVITGTYLRDSEYERRTGYAASVVGSPYVVIRPFANELRLNVSLE